MYNRVFNRLKNYYVFVYNYSLIAFSTQYILILSFAKLLAAKFKLKTIRDTYIKNLERVG